jgi:hypothetical protein
MSKQYSNDQRYVMWVKVVTAVRGKIDRGDIFTVYLEQLNKCRYQHEFDQTLDAIIFNEKHRIK